MKWLEIIELSYSDADKKKLENQLARNISEINSEIKPYSVIIFEHENIKNQFLIYMHYNSNNPGMLIKSLGRKLVSTLNQSTLINIAVMGE